MSTIPYIADEAQLKSFREGAIRQVWIPIEVELTECERIERLSSSEWAIVHNHGITMHIRRKISCPYAVRSLLSVRTQQASSLCPERDYCTQIVSVEAKTLGEMTLEDMKAMRFSFPSPYIGIGFDGMPVEHEHIDKDPWWWFAEWWNIRHPEPKYSWKEGLQCWVLEVRNAVEADIVDR